eukprot:GHVU01007273.1.p1 GENE.GHVU01007273.1~~GHVU01007273.1.p1  ORF type:complete len:124 (+),score=9.82 GHVU01007273.1:649-1020(+)
MFLPFFCHCRYCCCRCRCRCWCDGRTAVGSMGRWMNWRTDRKTFHSLIRRLINLFLYYEFIHPGRKPAFCDNLMLATAAPYFVVLEFLFIFCNYAPEMQKELEAATLAKLETLPKLPAGKRVD